MFCAVSDAFGLLERFFKQLAWLLDVISRSKELGSAVFESFAPELVPRNHFEPDLSSFSSLEQGGEHGQISRLLLDLYLKIRGELSPSTWSVLCFEMSATIEFQTKPSRICRKNSNTRALSDSDFYFLRYFVSNSILMTLGHVFELIFLVSLLHKVDLRKNKDLTRKSESLRARVQTFSRSGINILDQNKLVPEISKQKTACGTFETIQNVKLHILG